MGLAETAQLGVNLHLGTTGSFAGATAQLGALESAASRGTGALAGGLGKAQKAASSFGGAMSHAKGAIGGLLTGPLGVLGLSAGVFSLGAILEQTIGKTTDFAFSVEKLQGLTGGTAEAMSGLLAVFEKFGVNAERTGMIVGFTEKTLGKLAANGKLSTKILEDYGFAVRNANGTVKTFGQTLNYVSDYYNANHSAAQKAALAAQLFGRGYADLIPILKLGSKGIADAGIEAADLGLILRGTDAQSVIDYRKALRDLGDAASGLQLQIGLALIPHIKDLAVSLTSFVRDNRVGIVQFFSDAATNVGKFGNFIAKDVLPPLKQLGSVAKGAWDLIPDPLKQILVGGIIANKAGKFLFDISIKDAAGGAFDLGKSLLGKGGNPANPLFVKDVGGLGGLGSLAGEAAGGAAAFTASTALILAAGAIAAGVLEANILQGFADKNNALAAAGLSPSQISAAKYNAASPADQELFRKHGYAPVASPILPDSARQNTYAAQTAGMDAFANRVAGDFASIDRQGVQFQRSLRDMAAAARAAAHEARVLAKQHADLAGLSKGIHDRSVARYGGKGLGKSAEDATYQHDILGLARSIMRHAGSSVERLDRLKQLAKDATNATDATKRVLSGDIKTLSSRVLHAKPPQVSVTVGTNVEVSANSVVTKFTQTRRYGPSDPTNKHGGNPGYGG